MIALFRAYDTVFLMILYFYRNVAPKGAIMVIPHLYNIGGTPNFKNHNNNNKGYSGYSKVVTKTKIRFLLNNIGKRKTNSHRDPY